MFHSLRWPVCFGLFLFILSCDKEEVTIVETVSYERVSGFVQKGPFLNGTSITVSELLPNLTPTGRTFSSQVLDNRGTFSLADVRLSSRYAQLRANGFYFNEVTGENSGAQLTLYALSDLESRSDLNVNLLSTLEKGRVEYLISQGTDFAAAKRQAQTEILAIFEMGAENMPASEQLDITRPGTDNGKLLALSVILQGDRDVAGLSELVANISTDIRTDGILNSELLGTELHNAAALLDTAAVRANLERRYDVLGLTISVPTFAEHVKRFTDSTDFAFTQKVTYPESYEGVSNLLADDVTELELGTKYYLITRTPTKTAVKVEIRGGRLEGRVVKGMEFRSYQGPDYTYVSTTEGEGVVELNLYPRQYFQNDTLDYVSPPAGPTIISVYENGATTPTFTKEVQGNN